MDTFDEKIDSIFDDLSKSLVDKYKFNSKVVNDRITRLKQFTKKADSVYFKYLKKCTDEFFNEEEKIYDEISTDLNADETLTDEITQVVAEIEEICCDTHKIVEQSRELSKGIETINKRIHSYEQLQKTYKELKDVIRRCEEIVPLESKENAMLVDEM